MQNHLRLHHAELHSMCQHQELHPACCEHRPEKAQYGVCTENGGIKVLEEGREVLVRTAFQHSRSS